MNTNTGGNNRWPMNHPKRVIAEWDKGVWYFKNRW